MSNLTKLDKRVQLVGLCVLAFSTFCMLAIAKKIFLSSVKAQSVDEVVLNLKENKILPNGIIEEGIFIDDKLEGDGKRTHLTGNIEEGVFSKGEFTQGKLIFSNGMIDEGCFKGGSLCEGKVKMTMPDGITYAGELTNGSVIGKKTLLDGSAVLGKYGIFTDITGARKILKLNSAPTSP